MKTKGREAVSREVGAIFFLLVPSSRRSIVHRPVARVDRPPHRSLARPSWQVLGFSRASPSSSSRTFHAHVALHHRARRERNFTPVTRRARLRAQARRRRRRRRHGRRHRHHRLSCAARIQPRSRCVSCVALASSVGISRGDFFTSPSVHASRADRRCRGVRTTRATTAERPRPRASRGSPRDGLGRKHSSKLSTYHSS